MRSQVLPEKNSFRFHHFAKISRQYLIFRYLHGFGVQFSNRTFIEFFQVSNDKKSVEAILSIKEICWTPQKYIYILSFSNTAEIFWQSNYPYIKLMRSQGLPEKILSNFTSKFAILVYLHCFWYSLLFFLTFIEFFHPNPIYDLVLPKILPYSITHCHNYYFLTCYLCFDTQLSYDNESVTP